MGRARNLLVLGTASGVGKTLLTVAICRWLRSRGVDVAPFKALSMQDDGGVYLPASGGHVHFHQAFQARGAGLEPVGDMNPIAVWRQYGQITTAMRGKVDGQLLAMPTERRTATARAAIMESYLELSKQHEFVVIEGCGSPVELNLMQRDVSNLWLAGAVDAPCLLVGSVLYTGVFAAMVGTLELMTPAERARVIGLVVNRYMGDPRDFAAGAAILEQRCGVPCLGTIPDFPALDRLGETPRNTGEIRRLLDSADLDAEIDRWTEHVAANLDLDRLLVW